MLPVKAQTSLHMCTQSCYSLQYFEANFLFILKTFSHVLHKVNSVSPNSRFDSDSNELFACCFFFHAFLCSADIFQNSLFQIILSVSNSLDPDQAQCSSGPDLGPNCKDHQQTTKFAAGVLVLTRNLKIGVKLLFARKI